MVQPYPSQPLLVPRCLLPFPAALCSASHLPLSFSSTTFHLQQWDLAAVHNWWDVAIGLTLWPCAVQQLLAGSAKGQQERHNPAAVRPLLVHESPFPPSNHISFILLFYCHTMSSRALALLLCLALALALGPGQAAAQATANGAATSKKVGVLDLFPFAYKGLDGKLTGERGCVSTCASRALAVARELETACSPAAASVHVLHSRAGAWQGETCSQTNPPSGLSGGRRQCGTSPTL